ncbi:MAG: hypothetical protein EXQ59_03665 [Acidobacteria bacterium]|nr:hypothetical protein [Acidobacteriota bacterium]
MKVSVFTRPDKTAAIAAAYLAAHLPFLAPSLEDYDSINFALGLRDFDPALHQPHPPGSPVYIALGRALLPFISGAVPSLSRTHAEALTLAIWSVVAGVVAIVAAGYVFAAIARDNGGDNGDSRIRQWAIALFAVSPLFWMSGLRPMSDLPGLAAALVGQALILQGRTDRRRLVYGALVSGLAAGIRVQTVCLTLPLLAFALFEQRRAGIWWLTSRPVAALSAGVIAWMVPLVVDSGGVEAYLGALGSQAGEDFAWVSMLWLEPTPRRLAFTLYETFVLPWGFIPLAAVIAAAAALGGVLMLVRQRQALLLLLLAFAPYTLFHLLFQETITVRYALPTLPLVVWLAARGLAAAGRLMPIVATAVVAGALAVAVPASVAYGREPHPAFRAIADASRRAAGTPPAAIFSHHSVWRSLYAEGALPAVPEPPRFYEWLGPVRYWKDGGLAPVWFFADPRRTDLALIDPQARLDVVRYEWAVAGRPELGGSRPLGTDWYRIAAPGWFAEEGWSLTPETGGLARATAAGPDHRPIEAWVRRRPGPLHLLVGGRHLGEPGDPSAEFELALDAVVRDRWTLSVEARNFLRFVDVPDGIAAGDGPYARLTIRSRASGGDRRRAAVGIRQFDVQSATHMLYAFGEGWHEEEYDAATGRRWRWTSERSILRLKGTSGSVKLTIRGESPLRYFDAPPTVRITAGMREIAHFRPDADFTWTVIVPGPDVSRAGGAIAIETDPVYLPGPAEGTSDERHLGLRVYECRVDPVLP